MDFLDFRRRDGLAGVKKSDTSNASGTKPARSDRSSNRPGNRSPASDRLIHIVALLIVLVALVSLANQALGLLPGVDGSPLSLQRLLGWLMAPVAWMAGIPWSECAVAGSLLGTKTVLNELLAYIDLAQLPPDTLAPRSQVIMTYALCGFANLGSLGILLGGMCAIAPQRRAELVQLGPLTLISGTLATLSCGSVVAMLTSSL